MNKSTYCLQIAAKPDDDPWKKLLKFLYKLKPFKYVKCNNIINTF